MIYFLFNRFEDDNRFEGAKYAKMRHYFANRLIRLFKRFFRDDLSDATLLDVGGASGDFCHYFNEKAGMKCVNIDPDEQKIARASHSPSYVASGVNIPFDAHSFDFVISRGVIEHVPIGDHQKFINECYRVLKPGGIAYISSSPWLAPWAGHQLAPFHIFPIRIACFLTNFFFRKKYAYTSYAEADLYYLSFRGFKKMCEKAGFVIEYREDPVTKIDFLNYIPLVREVFVQHMAFLMRKPLTAPSDQPKAC
jgi:ubiquinone/menaquinone biosynthesis C-methylase UbiE